MALGSGHGASSLVPGAPVLAKMQEDVDAAMADALEHATAQDIAEASAPSPTDLTMERLHREMSEAWRIHKAARVRAEEDRKRLENHAEELRKQEQSLKAERKALDDLREARRKESEVELVRLDSERKELTTRREDVEAKERDALSGFAEARWKRLDQLRAEEEALQGRIAALETRLLSEQSRLDAERVQQLDVLRAEMQRYRDEAAAATSAEREALAAEHQRLAAERAEIALDRQDLQDERRALESRVARDVARQIGEVARERDELAAQLERAGRDNLALRERVAAADRLTQRFGGREPQEILAEMARLSDEVVALRQELSNRPTKAEGERLEQLVLAERSWGEERSRMEQRLAELEAREASAQTAAWHLEALKKQRTELEAVQALQEARLEKLRREIEENLRNATDTNPFRAFRDLDESQEHQKSVATKGIDAKLSDFLTWVRYRIVEVSQKKKRQEDGTIVPTAAPLYYSEEDLRLFLAGMAMSPLMILQGVSGTGKTSLPLVFAEAMGAGWHRHAVQAGWRDRHDLLGHFNSFEGRFYASRFLRALYEAQTPAFADRPYIIVLDEMNLSSPEQYFADFLSEFEAREADERRIFLVDQQFVSGPRHLLDGNAIRIPENVWFVGTANHDETTMGFAPKTYDRAHVMELQRKGDPLPGHRVARDKGSINLSSLRRHFAAAAQEHEQDCTSLLGFIYGELRLEMDKLFRIGWGERLERQVRAFLPVVRACNGTVSEAADHILSTKVLRPLRQRHDNRPDHLEQIRSLMLQRWQSFAPDGRPVRVLQLLDKELADRRNDVMRDGE